MKKSTRLSRLFSLSRRKSFLREEVTRKGLTVETLEPRSLMAGLPGALFTSAYHNNRTAADVNGDGAVKVNDAIAIIQSLRRDGARSISASGAGEGEASATNTNNSSGYYYDVNADGNINIVDAVKVVKALRAEGEVAQQVQFTVKAVPVNGDGSVELGTAGHTTIEKGQEFDLLVSVRDLRNKGDFLASPLGGVLNPKLDIDFNGVQAHVESNEIQYLSLPNATNTTTGSFNISFDGSTRSVTFNSNKFTTGANIKAALESISTIGVGNVDDVVPVSTTGEPFRWRIHFIGQLKDTDVPKIQGDAGTLGGGVTFAVDDGTPTGAGLQGRIEATNTAGDKPWDVGDDPTLSTVQLLNNYNSGLPFNVAASHDVAGVNSFGAVGTIANPNQTSDTAGHPELFPDVQFMRIRMVASEGVVVNSSTKFVMTPGVASDNSTFPLQFLQLEGETGTDPNFPVGGPVAVVDQLFTPTKQFQILQYVTAVADGPASSSVGGSQISINVLTNDLAAKDPLATNVQITKVGSAPETLTGNLFASNSLKSALGGTLSISGNNVLYTPPATLPANTPVVGGIAVDSFVYTVEDLAHAGNAAYRDTQIVKINLTVPVLGATADDLTQAEKPNAGPVSYTLDVMANDSLGNSQPTVIDTLDKTAFLALNIGTLDKAPDNKSIIFTPTDPDYFNKDVALGIDSPFTFSYTLKDSASPTPNTTTPVVVTVHITNTNDLPVLRTPDFLNKHVDEKSTNNVIDALTGNTPGPANETGAGRQTISLQSVVGTTAQGGTAVKVGNTIQYTPLNTFTGDDTITYTIVDNGNPNLAATGTITVHVDPIARPSAVNDDYDIVEGRSTPFTMNILANDRPHTTPVLSTIRLVSFNANAVIANTSTVVGTVALTTPTALPAAGATLDFTLDTANFADFFGDVTFTYTVDENPAQGNDPGANQTATVTIHIANDNDAPTAQDQTLFVGKNTTANAINVTTGATVGPANEVGIDTLIVSGVGTASKGTVTIGTGGNVLYTPAAGQSGDDSFTFTLRDRPANDPAGKTVQKTVTVHITPNAVNDSGVGFAVREDSGGGDVTNPAIDLDVLTNDQEFGGLSGDLTITGTGPASHGTVNIVSNGSRLQYIPAANFYGTDSFTYTIKDSGNRTATATVNVSITEENDNPTVTGTATRQVIKAFGIQDVTADILAKVSSSPDDAAHTNPNGTPVIETLKVTNVTPVASGTGTIAVDNTGKVTYDPTGIAAGTYDFNYVVADDRGGTASGTLKITVLDFVPTSVSGYVYQDGTVGSPDGVRNPGEKGYGGVKVTLTGTDFLGNAVTVDKFTSSDGFYSFPNMVPGDYDIIEEQPKFVLDGSETAGVGASVTSNFNATTGARDTIHISIPITGFGPSAPSGSTGNNFGERGMDVVTLTQSNQANGGPTGNIWLADLSTSASRDGFFLFVNGSVAGVSQTLKGWTNIEKIDAILSADKKTLTLTFTAVGGGAWPPVILSLNAGAQSGFRIMGFDSSGGALVRIDGSAALVLGAGNPFIPVTPAAGEGEGFAAGVDAVFGGA